MKVPRPRWSKRRFEYVVQGIDFDFELLYKHRDELLKICDEMEKIKSDSITIALKKYILISLTTIIEDSFMKLVKNEIDHFKLDLSNIQDDILSKINTKNIPKYDHATKGTIVASSYNFQNFKEIDSVCSMMTNLPFFETIKKLINLPRDDDVDYNQEWDSDRRILYDNWNDFENIADTRNKIVHTIGEPLSDENLFDVDKLRQSISVIFDAITFSTIFLQIFIEILQEKPRDRLEEDLRIMLGNKSKTIRDIIKDQNRLQTNR